jgi:hypothetical protein
LRNVRHPERIQSQIEGTAIMGLSLAKHGAITFKDGKVQQGNFDDFPVIRIDEPPAATNVYIVPPGPDTPPSGVGEPGVPPFAPALINAIFAATGKRIRTADREAIGGVRGTLDCARRFIGLRGERSMKPNATALAVSLLSGMFLLNTQAATAQTTSPPNTTATRPATTPPGQTSLPNESPPATTTQTTGEASRDPVVKKMNEDEKQKVDTKGK